MSLDDDDSVLSPDEFANIVANHYESQPIADRSFIDSTIFICSELEIDLEEITNYMSEALKSKLHNEAQTLKLLKSKQTSNVLF